MLMNERKLTRKDIKRWLRQGKAIKAGDTWYLIARSSSKKEGLLLTTADWELSRGKDSKGKIVTYDELLDKVNNGNWTVKINDKFVGKKAEEEEKKPRQTSKKESIVSTCDSTAALLVEGPMLNRMKRWFKKQNLKTRKQVKTVARQAADRFGVPFAEALKTAVQSMKDHERVNAFGDTQFESKGLLETLKEELY